VLVEAPSAHRPGGIRPNQREKGDIRTEVTPTSDASIIMGLASGKCKQGTPPLGCAQIVPNICQEYQKISDNIEVHRNPGDLKSTFIAE
jgi:hypothetical protein